MTAKYRVSLINGDETSHVECGGYNEAMKYAEVEGAKGIHVTVEALEARYRKVAEFNAPAQPIPEGGEK